MDESKLIGWYGPVVESAAASFFDIWRSNESTIEFIVEVVKWQTTGHHIGGYNGTNACASTGA